jgi:hypothetical protein
MLKNEIHENLWYTAEKNFKLHIVSLFYLQQLSMSIFVCKNKTISQSSSNFKNTS